MSRDQAGGDPGGQRCNCLTLRRGLGTRGWAAFLMGPVFSQLQVTLGKCPLKGTLLGDQAASVHLPSPPLMSTGLQGLDLPGNHGPSRWPIPRSRPLASDHRHFACPPKSEVCKWICDPCWSSQDTYLSPAWDQVCAQRWEEEGTALGMAGGSLGP